MNRHTLYYCRIAIRQNTQSKTQIGVIYYHGSGSCITQSMFGNGA